MIAFDPSWQNMWQVLIHFVNSLVRPLVELLVIMEILCFTLRIRFFVASYFQPGKRGIM